MDDTLLVDLVRKYVFLYDKTHKDFKNKLMKRNAWESIAEVLEDSVENVEQRWTVLRNRYTTEKRKLVNTPTGSEGGAPTWQYFQAMSFLDNFIVPRKTHGNPQLKKPQSASPSLELFDELNLPSQEWDSMPQILQHESEVPILLENDEAHLTASSSSGVSTPDFQKQGSYLKRKACNRPNNKQELSQAISNAFTNFSKVFDKANTQVEEESEEFLFGKTIAKSLERIQCKKTKARIKIEILEVLEKYED